MENSPNRITRRKLGRDLLGIAALVGGGALANALLNVHAQGVREQQITRAVMAAGHQEIAGDIATWPKQVVESAINNTFQLWLGTPSGDPQGTAFAIHSEGFTQSRPFMTARHVVTNDGRSPGTANSIGYLQLIRRHNHMNLIKEGHTAVSQAGLSIVVPRSSADVAAFAVSEENLASSTPGIPIIPDYQPQTGERLYIPGYPKEDALSAKSPLYGTTASYICPYFDGRWLVSGLSDSGASGSPVLNEDGRAVGVFTDSINEWGSLLVVTPIPKDLSIASSSL